MPRFEHVSQGSHAADDDEDVGLAWTAEQAQAWRQSHRPTSLWQPVWFQAAATLLATLLAWALGGSTQLALCALYGAGAALLPSAVFAWGLGRMARRQRALSAPAATGCMALALWEAVKIVLTAAMLWSAPRWLGQVSWPVLLLALMVVINAWWLALAYDWRSRQGAE